MEWNWNDEKGYGWREYGVYIKQEADHYEECKDCLNFRNQTFRKYLSAPKFVNDGTHATNMVYEETKDRVSSHHRSFCLTSHIIGTLNI